MTTIFKTLLIKDDNFMNGFPPPVLVKTWLFIARNQNDYEFGEKQLFVRREIKRIFGSMELADLYIEQANSLDSDTYYL